MTYQELAEKYAEEHNIVDYQVRGENMVYFSNLEEIKQTYRVIVNLVAQVEESRKKYKGYIKGVRNIGR